MNADLIQNIVNGFVALIQDELARPEEGAGKFKRISMLCMQAREVIEMNVTNVEEADTEMEDRGAINTGLPARRGIVNGIGYGNGVMFQGEPNVPNNYLADTIRGVLGAAEPVVEVLRDMNNLKRVEQQREGIDRLLDWRERLASKDTNTAEIDAKIAAALEALAPMQLGESATAEEPDASTEAAAG